MKITFITFGKLKTPGLEETLAHYKKMLSVWVQTQDIELKPALVSDKSPATRLKVQEKEMTLLEETLKNKVGGRAKIFILDESGKILASQGWATLLEKHQNEGISDFAFCVGSALGFHKDLKTKYATLALGPQTLSHDLARIVCFEQIYRAVSILKGHPYHHEG